VWSIVTDYDHYDRFLPWLEKIEAERRKDGCFLQGKAQGSLRGHWPFAIDIHESKSDLAWSSTWEQMGGKDLVVNRGGWTLIDRGKQTLLVLALEVEVKGYPAFLVRNVLMYRLPRVLQAAEERLWKEEME
jgi:hypothetical protein